MTGAVGMSVCSGGTTTGAVGMSLCSCLGLLEGVDAATPAAATPAEAINSSGGIGML